MSESTKRTYVKLTQEQKAEIHSRFANNEPAEKLAKEFGVSLSTIIRYGKEGTNGKRQAVTSMGADDIATQSKAFIQSLRDRATVLNDKANEFEELLADLV